MNTLPPSNPEGASFFPGFSSAILPFTEEQAVDYARFWETQAYSGEYVNPQTVLNWANKIIDTYLQNTPPDSKPIERALTVNQPSVPAETTFPVWQSQMKQENMVPHWQRDVPPPKGDSPDELMRAVLQAGADAAGGCSPGTK
ncbi:hypothetical protein A3A66_04135 [Microgenomates group bacterium RIFCSPLOWO2_01_FULL_46_13]|nr:MAG: hypothetical protein A2783_03610 [Microgenomates group bacterium RIFCSPHIGHO2_01_FULL_45_11]OGV94976.1 MAG: hypothetical protein A3A66_04135 [Microgenomates group bacterium RIFCSPLOWO2_01_FULL_46_13]